MGKRRKSREIAFKLLYAQELSGSSQGKVIIEYKHYYENVESEIYDYATKLFEWTMQENSRIDQDIQTVVSNWSLNRISIIDKNLIRMGCAEMLQGGVAVGIVINEIVELAKIYGEKDSYIFINGVLDSWYNTIYNKR